MGTVVESAEDIDHLMAATGPSVGLLLDTGHAVFAGADPAALAKKHISRIVHVHCKDVRKEMPGWLPGKYKFPQRRAERHIHGAGRRMWWIIPPSSILARAGYNGWLVVEAGTGPRQGASAHLREARLPQPAGDGSRCRIASGKTESLKSVLFLQDNARFDLAKLRHGRVALITIDDGERLMRPIEVRVGVKRLAEFRDGVINVRRGR